MFPPQGLVAAALQPYTLVSLLLTPNVTADSQTLNAAPTASTVTAANAKSFTGTIGQIALPAITPAANGSGITLTGLNFTQGAISNIADSEAITVKMITVTGAAGAALATGVYTWTWADITMPNQAANAANNQATGIKITGGALAGGASAYQRGIDITMAAATDVAIRVGVGRVVLPSDAIEGISASGRVTIYGGLNGSTAAGSGAVLSLDAESFAGTPGAMRVYTPNAAGTDNILRLVVNGMAAQGAGGITSYEPITAPKLGFGAIGSLTIAGGAITVTKSYHKVVVEGGTGAGADALTSAAGGSEGDVLILSPATSGVNDTVTVTDGTGAGAFILNAGANFAMDSVDDRIGFIHNGTEWVELFRSTGS